MSVPLSLYQLDHLAVDDAQAVVLFRDAVLGHRVEMGMLAAAQAGYSRLARRCLMDERLPRNCHR